ncbi:MAG: quinone oxidoreductase [Planctomycetes bacterium]|nr:quinone oxidoreductase [Planctomycetota bacterium]
MTRVLRIHQPGGPDRLAIESLELPAPARGEVRLRHEAIGVDFIDCHHRAGRYPLPVLPHGLGLEAVGVVEAIGDGVTGLCCGDRVAYAGGAPGAYAEARNVEAWRLLKVPDGLDATLVAAAFLRGLTAEFLVRRTFKVGPGHRVLVHAAAGGLGGLLCQWLRHVGATVFGTVSTQDKVDCAYTNGCHHVLVRGEASFVDGVRRITTQKGLDVVYDSIGQSTLRDSLRCLHRRGLLVAFGYASGVPAAIELAELANGSFFVTRPRLDDYCSTRQELVRAAEVLFPLLRFGVLRPQVAAVLPLGEAAVAHARLEAGGSMGSFVLVP